MSLSFSIFEKPCCSSCAEHDAAAGETLGNLINPNWDDHYSPEYGGGYESGGGYHSLPQYDDFPYPAEIPPVIDDYPVPVITPQTTAPVPPPALPAASVPAWAIGTFYGSTSSSGGQITLTILPNGQVTAQFQNAGPLSGMLSGNVLNIDNALATLSPSAQGITAVRSDNGHRIEYSRTPADAGSLPVQTSPPLSSGGQSPPFNPGPGKQDPLPADTPAVPEVLGFEIDPTTILIGGAVAVTAVVLLSGD